MLLLYVCSVHAAGMHGDVAIQRFCDNAGQRSRNISFVVEVGAHDGSWGDRVMTRCRQIAPASRIRLVIFEPQPNFHGNLKKIADKWNGVLYPAAAWIDSSNRTFFLSNFEEASSLSEVMALTFNDPEVRPTVKRITVRAVDLASIMTRMLARANLGSVILKLDTEASEYDLLPRLITSGVLCRVGYILIEWHLNGVVPERRLAGVLMRNHLDALLRRGCRTAPQTILHDDDFANNFGEPVPGLTQLAQRYETSLNMQGKRPFSVATSLIAGARQPHTRISKFLHASSEGVCHHVLGLSKVETGCDEGRKGSWHIRIHKDRSWTALASACLEKCDLCHRCRFLSVNIRGYECYWWAACDLNRLTSLHGAITGRVLPAQAATR